jgi:SAM-dependent methyltransferase
MLERLRLLLLKIIFHLMKRPIFLQIGRITRQEMVNAALGKNGRHTLSPPSMVEKTETPEFVKTIRTFSEWDDFVEEADRLAAVDPKKFHEHLLAHIWDIQAFISQFEQNGGSVRKNNPFSEPDYFDREREFFEFISGKPYDYKHEGLNLDINDIKKNYPLSCYRNFIGYNWNGFCLLDFIQPRVGDRFLELGYGLGNLLELFGRAGCQVSGVDASPSFLELALWRCALQNIKVGRLTQGPFSLAGEFQGPFDYIAFDAAFHHCEHPVDILSLLRSKIREKGRLIFFNEPIADYFERPWGFVRSDGETALQIRKRAWFEIGIRTDFFKELLEKTGWRLLDTSSHQFLIRIFVAEPM